jgi:hypothetical protein
VKSLSKTTWHGESRLNWSGDKEYDEPRLFLEMIEQQYT